MNPMIYVPPPPIHPQFTVTAPLLAECTAAAVRVFVKDVTAALLPADACGQSMLSVAQQVGCVLACLVVGTDC